MKLSIKDIDEAINQIFYYKELDNLKNNIIRTVDWNDKNCKDLEEYCNLGQKTKLWIEIYRTDSNKSFTRLVKDITFFQANGIDLVVITWFV